MKAWMSSNFGKFETELLPLINVRIEFLLNILKTNRPIKTKFCIHIIIDKIYFGISTANIKAVRGSLWWLSVNKLSHIPELQSVSAVYENQ